MKGLFFVLKKSIDYIIIACYALLSFLKKEILKKKEMVLMVNKKKVDERLERQKNLLLNSGDLKKKDFREICRMLEIDCDCGVGYHQLEGIFHVVLRVEDYAGVSFHDLLNRVADEFVADSTCYEYWMHSLCHLFESYGRSASILNSPTNRDIAWKMVEEGIKRSLKEGVIDNISRVIDGLIILNFDLLELKDINNQFPFRPEFPSEFVDMYRLSKDKRFYSEVNYLWISHSKPVDVIVEIVEQLHIAGLPVIKTSKKIALIEAARERIDPDKYDCGIKYLSGLSERKKEMVS